jgi:acyl carrier protein
VAQALAVAEQADPDDPHLLAYARCHEVQPSPRRSVAGQDTGEQHPASNAERLAIELREYLRQQLPSYMLPRQVMLVDHWPLTPNGKINVRQLPHPQASNAPTKWESASDTGHRGSSDHETSPAHSSDEELSPAETLLASTWQQFLRVPIRDRQANFFDLGGHSLLVVQVIQNIHQKTGIRLSPQDFLTGSLEQLAALLEGSSHTSRSKASAISSDVRPEPTAWARLKGFWHA